MRRAFTLLEVLCVIAIVASLASILLPVFAQAKRSAKTATCATNLRNLGHATALYALDYDDLYPFAICRHDRADLDAVPYELWPLAKAAPDVETLLLRYVGDAAGFHCPLDEGLMESIGIPAFARFGSSYQTAALLEGQSTTCWRDPAAQGYAHDDSPYWHALDRENYEGHRTDQLYYDGHVKLVRIGKSDLSVGCAR